ncbi:YhcN/YlaJ family sporulation lipoprotein [Robertmurraya massiliosenegalensis]|uniref:YhcN/YlaJ family sporulation lipoprotein n=1 Tax=Robertmurraya massiliosenegalensis TaxID=1287657 RepID=UPI00030BD747|nr:YhcN/YlaJ family sporulation lipoprotein [Robertmurraya massiliosenegalensis]
MNKIFLFISVSFLFLITACNNDDAAVEGLYNKSGNTINVNDQRADIYNKNGKNKSEDFGYVRHQKEPIMGSNVSNDHYEAMDREKTADTISKLCTDIPNVDDVSTLVTGEEVIIVYATETENRNLAADQVKKTAMSVVPRWFDIYVTDNTALRKNVESYATMDSDSKKVEYALDELIKEIKKSPQGDNDDNNQ